MVLNTRHTGFVVLNLERFIKFYEGFGLTLVSRMIEVGEYIDRGIDTLKNASENINLPEMFENLKKELGPIAEPVIERGKEFLKELGITVRVDLNSTSPELAEMFVAEIDRNPKLKSDLAGKIFGNKREYT